MRARPVVLVIGSLGAVVLAGLLWPDGSEPPPDASETPQSRTRPAPAGPPLPPRPPREALESAMGSGPDGVSAEAGGSSMEPEPRARANAVGPERSRWRDADIEEIKQAIYEREIDTVERLGMLEEFVQTGDADTREFWSTDWAGVDDWKRHDDGFHLDRTEEGALIFVPDAETARSYTFMESINVFEYDAEREMFVHEVDYFGKPIINVVKFLREDVLVTMTVSGEKVDLNIYERGEAPPNDPDG